MFHQSTTYQEEGFDVTPYKCDKPNLNLTGMTHKGITSHTSGDFGPT